MAGQYSGEEAKIQTEEDSCITIGWMVGWKLVARRPMVNASKRND